MDLCVTSKCVGKWCCSNCEKIGLTSFSCTSHRDSVISSSQSNTLVTNLIENHVTSHVTDIIRMTLMHCIFPRLTN